MEKNKSIDGLSPHHSKKAVSLVAPARKTTTKKLLAKSSKPAIKTAESTKPIKIPIQKEITQAEPTGPTPATIRTPENPAQPDTTQATTNITEDFLSPTQVFDFDEKSGELKAAKNSTTVKPSKQKVKKPMSKARKIIIWTIIIIILLVAGGFTWLILWGNDIIAKITGGQGNVFDLVFPTETYEPLKTDSNGRTNILAFGTSGYNMEGDEGEGTHDGAQLTDSIMVISLDQETGDTAMLSLPRDLKASPTCTATGKINEVYWCNGGGGDISTKEEAIAAQALIDEVGSILDIDFQYFVHVNWGSLVNVVDTLGGITVTLDEDIRDYYYYDAGGTYTIYGNEALWLARMRYGTAHGDFSRANSQQKILIGLKNRVLEKDLSITELVGLASTLGDNLRTNFSLDEMKTLAHLASTSDFDNMRQVSLIDPEYLVTTGTINGISYVLPVGGVGYYTNIQDHVAKMFSSDPRSYEDYNILVLNATETPGLASTEKATLEEAGYDNIYIDDAPEGEYLEGYTLYSTVDTAPGTKKLLEKQYSTTVQPADTLPTNITTGYSFIIIINNADADSE